MHICAPHSTTSMLCFLCTHINLNLALQAEPAAQSQQMWCPKLWFPPASGWEKPAPGAGMQRESCCPRGLSPLEAQTSTGTRPLATSPGKSPIGFCWKCLERKCVLALQAYTRMSEHLLQLSGLPWAKLKCILGLTKVIFSSVPSNSAARVKSRKHILLGFISTC